MATYGQWLRSKNIRTDLHRDRNRDHERELDLYRETRRQGVQPASTKTDEIREALDVSDRLGRAFDAGKDHKYVIE